jgi:hypothetical protein
VRRGGWSPGAAAPPPPLPTVPPTALPTVASTHLALLLRELGLHRHHLLLGRAEPRKPRLQRRELRAAPLEPLLHLRLRLAPRGCQRAERVARARALRVRLVEQVLLLVLPLEPLPPGAQGSHGAGRCEAGRHEDGGGCGQVWTLPSSSQGATNLRIARRARRPAARRPPPPDALWSPPAPLAPPPPPAPANQIGQNQIGQTLRRAADPPARPPAFDQRV